jgi:hypothetical protein
MTNAEALRNDPPSRRLGAASEIRMIKSIGCAFVIFAFEFPSPFVIRASSFT